MANQPTALWKNLHKSASILEIVFGFGFFGTLVASNPQAAMDWANANGLLLFFGGMTLFFGVVWLVTWAKTQRESLDNYRKEREAIMDAYGENVRGLLLESVGDMARVLEEGNAKRYNEIERTLRDLGVCFAATVPYLNDLVDHRELEFLPEKWRVQIRDAPETPDA